MIPTFSDSFSYQCCVLQDQNPLSKGHTLVIPKLKWVRSLLNQSIVNLSFGLIVPLYVFDTLDSDDYVPCVWDGMRACVLYVISVQLLYRYVTMDTLPDDIAGAIGTVLPRLSRAIMQVVLLFVNWLSLTFSTIWRSCATITRQPDVNRTPFYKTMGNLHTRFRFFHCPPYGSFFTRSLRHPLPLFLVKMCRTLQ